MSTLLPKKIYSWRGMNNKGEHLSGTLAAANQYAVLMKLEELNILPLQIKKKFRMQIFQQKKIPHKYIIAFIHQLSSLVSANIPLANALNIAKINCQCPPAGHLITLIKDEIEKGFALSAVLKNYPQYFSAFGCNLIKAGEKSGTLDTMLNHLAAYNEKMLTLQRKLKKILFYPTLVLTIAILITAGLMVFVIPQFQVMFNSFGATLPRYTQAIINLAFFIKSRGIFLLIALLLIISSCIWINKRNTAFANFVDKNILCLPLFGKIIGKTIIARLARTLAITFQAGLPLHDVLEMAAEIIGNRYYKTAILKIRAEIIDGKSLHNAISATKLFPQYVLQLITIGEESGTLDNMLTKIASHYEDEVNYVTDNLQSLLEPIIMITLGLLVGGIIIGMYLPIFQLGKVI